MIKYYLDRPNRIIKVEKRFTGNRYWIFNLHDQKQGWLWVNVSVLLKTVLYRGQEITEEEAAMMIMETQ